MVLHGSREDKRTRVSAGDFRKKRQRLSLTAFLLEIGRISGGSRILQFDQLRHPSELHRLNPITQDISSRQDVGMLLDLCRPILATTTSKLESLLVYVPCQPTFAIVSAPWMGTIRAPVRVFDLRSCSSLVLILSSCCQGHPALVATPNRLNNHPFAARGPSYFSFRANCQWS